MVQLNSGPKIQPGTEPSRYPDAKQIAIRMIIPNALFFFMLINLYHQFCRLPLNTDYNMGCDAGCCIIENTVSGIEKR